jgi:RNA polymerase subunit RPABC4/transcription elongation factor Spt4
MEWITDLENAAEDVVDKNKSGAARLVILAPVGAEVYVNDERKGSIGSSGKLILTTIPAGQHILRVSKPGEKDDERVIELREGGQEQVIQAQLKPLHGTASQPSPSQSSQSGMAQSSIMPGIVACTNCQARFAEGVKFCGRCGNRSFTVVSAGMNSKSYTVCPRCSTQLPQNSKFCGRCGMNFTQQTGNKTTQSHGFYSGGAQPTPQPVQRVCRRCGASFPPNIKFCGRCGAGL